MEKRHPEIRIVWSDAANMTLNVQDDACGHDASFLRRRSAALVRSLVCIAQ
ncbi:hypothetical protein [Embleya sp. NPDC005971]|uniref:hypothetical protein n=1 Tax=unclassified Embleya TaxID=2699296 RepID=UPI0033D63A07